LLKALEEGGIGVLFQRLKQEVSALKVRTAARNARSKGNLLLDEPICTLGIEGGE
jgi:hypothetical protein